MNERQQQLKSEVEALKLIGETQSNVGDTILRSLWKIYALGLYKTESYDGKRFEDFRELCDDVIAPSFDDPDYLYDFSNIVERVFVYIQLRVTEGNPVTHPTTRNALTVGWLLDQKKWIGKLISISQGIEACQTDSEIESLFEAAILGTREGVKQKSEEIKQQHVPIIIKFVRRYNGNGSSTLISEELDDRQAQLIIKKLGKIIDLHLD